MDAETKNLYREKVAQVALRSDQSEMDVARSALALAREAEKRTYRDPKIGLREWVEITSERIPKPGKTMMYTAGWL